MEDNYSKAYKAKNRIITIIEKYGEYDIKNTEEINEISNNLASGGYQTVFNTNDECKKRFSGKGGNVLDVPETGGRGYHYCVIEYQNGLGKYYQVVTFMEFNIPILGGVLKFPVKGETKILYKNVG